MKQLVTFAVAVAVLVPAATARADDEFSPIGSFGTLGIGMATRLAAPAMSDDRSFDGALRLGPSWKVADPLWLGGFFELRTEDFKTMEVALGPQMQIRMDGDYATQLRAGVGVVQDGPRFATAGISVGTAMYGVSVAGRHYFDDDRGNELTVSLEVTPAILLLPLLPFIQWPRISDL
jgi:hypothetical protein